MTEKKCRLTAFALAVLLLLCAVGAGLPVRDISEVAAAENSVSMEVIMSRFPVTEVGRGASHALRRIRVSGSVVFCLDTDKHMDTGDTASVTHCYAPNYSNKKIAKALTYYFGDSGKTNMDFALVQAYIWAVEKNKDRSGRITAAYQGGKNYSSSYTRNKAEKLVDQIESITPRGTVYRYRINSCRAGLSLSTHQPLVTLKDIPPEPVNRSVTKTLDEIPEDEVSVKIRKLDEENGSQIEGDTTFLLSCSDGYRKEITLKGSKTVNYHRDLKKVTASSGSYEYVSNWNKLEVYQKTALTKKGYYSSKAKAQSAASKEAKKKLDAAVEKALEKGKYTWTLTETVPPEGYEISSQKLTLTEDRTHKSLTFQAKDRKIRGILKLIKKAGEGYEGADPDFSGTQYELDRADGSFVALLTIGDHNTATSGELPQGKYLLKEVHAIEGWALDPQVYTIDLENKEATETFVQEMTVSDVPADIPEGPLVRVRKNKKKDETVLPEAYTLFAVFDMDLIDGEEEDILKDANRETADERQAFLEKHAEACLGTMVTDEQGEASLRLPADAVSGEDRGLLILQIRGEKGYALCPPVCRQFDLPGINETEETETVENPEALKEQEIFFEAVDEYIDYGFIRIHKTKDMGPEDHHITVKDEESAEFVIFDETGGEAARLTTNEKGCAETKALPFGTYLIRQISGSGTHELCEDVYVTIDEEHRRETIEIALEDQPREVTFILDKSCKETGVSLPGAAFELYDADGKKVTAMVTGEDGTARLTLPFGEYTVKETLAPDGYVPAEEGKEFVLNASSVAYDEKNQGVYEMNEENAPIYGEIRAVKYATVPIGSEKLGTGDETEEQEAHRTGRFLYGEKPLSGVKLGLFAGESIRDVAGKEVYGKDDPVDEQVTNEKGQVHFERKLADGSKTHDLYQGEYYIKELSAPAGYIMSNRVETVRISADHTAEKVNLIEDTNPYEDYFSEKVYEPDGGPYVLRDGEQMNADPMFTAASSIRFLFLLPVSVDPHDCIDVSADGDGTLLMWQDGKGGVNIAPREAEHVIRFNRVSSHMFENCKNVTEIDLSNVDTSLTVDMSYLFAGCEMLRSLDLTGFNTLNVMNCSHMFEGCHRLESVYTVETDLERSEWEMEERPVKIVALPLNVFPVGDEIHYDDFWYTLFWDEDGDRSSYEREEELKITAADVAGIRGNTEKDSTVEIHLSDDGDNAAIFRKVFGSADPDAWILSVDIEVEKEKDSELLYDYHPVADVELHNDSVQLEYSIIKNDTEGNPLSGAVFGLYAACDIYSFDGIRALRAGAAVPEDQILFKEGSLITTAATGEDGEILITGLPNRIFAKPDSESMYYIKEIEAPPGYRLDETRQYFTGEPGEEGQSPLLSEVYFENEIITYPGGPGLRMPVTGVNDGRNLALIRLLFVVILLIIGYVERGRIREKVADFIKHHI